MCIFCKILYSSCTDAVDFFFFFLSMGCFRVCVGIYFSVENIFDDFLCNELINCWISSLEKAGRAYEAVSRKVCLLLVR